jgi:hypothetical protein
MLTVKVMLFVKTVLVPVMVNVLLGVDEQIEADTVMVFV